MAAKYIPKLEIDNYMEQHGCDQSAPVLLYVGGGITERIDLSHKTVMHQVPLYAGAGTHTGQPLPSVQIGRVSGV